MLTPNEPDIPFFAPPPLVPVALPPEIFDKEEFNELDWDIRGSTLEQFQFEDIFSALRDSDTYPVVTTPSLFTYSTDSQAGHEFAPSQYSSSNEFMSDSDYSAITPSSQAMHDFNITPNNSNSLFESPQPTGSFPSPPSIRPNYGISDPSQLFFGVSDPPGDLSHALNQSASADLPCNVPVYVTPDALTQRAPARANSKRKPFKCPHCPLSSARKHNLKKHIESYHQKLKPFMCNICKRPFGRKHDVQRHIEVKHEDRKPVLSTRPDTLITLVSINAISQRETDSHLKPPAVRPAT